MNNKIIVATYFLVLLVGIYIYIMAGNILDFWELLKENHFEIIEWTVITFECIF